MDFDLKSSENEALHDQMFFFYQVRNITGQNMIIIMLNQQIFSSLKNTNT